ncbi:MAG: hypothetical protein M1324_00155 [Patescibacteria group bacterium]|nr:hypothetical protein [Patescibacteria group bacterium]
MKKIGKQKYILHTISYFCFKTLCVSTNHQLFNKIVSWKLNAPFEILLSHKKKMMQATAAFGRRSAAFNNSNSNKSLQWWYLLNEERKYFERNS